MLPPEKASKGLLGGEWKRIDSNEVLSLSGSLRAASPEGPLVRKGQFSGDRMTASCRLYSTVGHPRPALSTPLPVLICLSGHWPGGQARHVAICFPQHL